LLRILTESVTLPDPTLPDPALLAGSEIKHPQIDSQPP
jgi:hypothetical protein